ncbi:gamma-glutamyltranspeptidase/glutathione hydrolase [Rhodopseudomonas julia]|uniref:Glutathione hydrolase proenzyme n=1 Tax=Rhodopseudomonas julia TaxID=200617 RepID=A0ABU0C3I0_9BRAD|nr:gamma-glutamyltransferase [Rhodopseudomonas julia]MDQ0325054.1 gamma-glutamyltranspeptidase/glutathione hydrolase [Rhodopseudomonas julia]
MLSSTVSAQDVSDRIQPELATQVAEPATAPVHAQNWMVAAANPLATEAGAQILRKGGSAIDAMVAVQLVLGLVEPQSSGLGGGAFLLYWDADAEELTTLDGRETAPSAATPKLFLDEIGEPLQFFDAVIGGRSVGVPGTPRLLEAAHKRWGTLAWPELFESAIRLAEDGFPVSPRLAGLVAEESESLARQETARAYFLDDLSAALAGDGLLKNEAYAATLKLLAANGADAFYKGPVAEDIVAAVRGFEANPGVMRLQDLKNYEVKAREPVCAAYRAYDVCGMGPPSSGGVTVGQILGLLARYDLTALGPESVATWRLIGDASRLAFADRGRYLADTDFVPAPIKGLLDPAYLQERAKLLEGEARLEAAEPGEPQWDHAFNYADGAAIEFPSTSHFVIVDRDGNVVSMTTTIENGFGSRLMVRGFLLNNELTDFSFKSQEDGRPVANRVESGKRPRSSMAPTIVLRDGAPVLAIGSPGGSRIIGYVAEALIAVLDWGMDVQAATALPHVVNRFGTFDLEAGTSAEDLQDGLEALGYQVEVSDLNSGLHAIAIGPDGLSGGADPRREGIAIGE